MPSNDIFWVSKAVSSNFPACMVSGDMPRSLEASSKLIFLPSCTKLPDPKLRSVLYLRAYTNLLCRKLQFPEVNFVWTVHTQKWHYSNWDLPSVPSAQSQGHFPSQQSTAGTGPNSFGHSRWFPVFWSPNWVFEPLQQDTPVFRSLWFPAISGTHLWELDLSNTRAKTCSNISFKPVKTID